MIEVNNLTKSEISETFLKKVAEKVLKGEKQQKKELSIALVSPKRAAELNKKYRKKDTVANVLSFAEPELGLGEIVICPQEVRKEAKKYGMMFEQGLAWMLVHGILHLLGYDHVKEGEARRMEQKEHRYLSRI